MIRNPLSPRRSPGALLFLFSCLVCVWFAASGAGGPTGCRGAVPPHAIRHLLIVVDGLRPDYVTPEVMPRLHAIGQRGLVFTRHHAVYPTVTRVNAASIATGAYPETHGLLGNDVFFPEVDAARFLDTGDRQRLLEIADATHGHLLTATTLAEALGAAGRRLLVVSGGGDGSSFLLNPTLAAGGAVLQASYGAPETLVAAERAALGPMPADLPPAAANDRAVDAFLRVGLPTVDPDVTILWLGEPDHTAHEDGPGAPATIAALRGVDAAIGRLEDGLRAAGLNGGYDLWVTSDHGFSTFIGGPSLDRLLAPFDATLPDGTRRIVTDGEAIYVRDGDRATIAAIVRCLQETPGFGAIFTRAAAPGSLNGWVEGTLSFDAARWDHARAADVLVSANWTKAANVHGVRGMATMEGMAGHGSTSPFDIHNTLIAAGPDVKRGATIDTPSGNVDFAPTFLSRLGIAVPGSMGGRVLEEAFTDAPAPAALGVSTSEHAAATADGVYRVTATFAVVESRGRRYRYLDRATIQRHAPPGTWLE